MARLGGHTAIGSMGLLVLALTAGCDHQSSVDAAEAPVNIAGVVVLQETSELPNCNPAHRGTVYYVQAGEDFYYCDGADYQPLDLRGLDGADGVAWVVEVTADPEECADGGALITAGPDLDGDGTMDAVASEQFVCDGGPGPVGPAGADGIDWQVTTEPADAATCVAGGVVVHVGPDLDGDGVLSATEIVSSQSLCNGSDGEDGEDGVNGDPGPAGTDWLIATEAADEAACANGGILVRVGPDTNQDGVLAEEETVTTSPVCNGLDAPVEGGGEGGAGGAGGAGGEPQPGQLGDADGDWLPDAAEDSNSNGIVDPGETDPGNPDTDGDGATDLVEVTLGTDPNDPASNPAASGDLAFVVPYQAAPTPATQSVRRVSMQPPAVDVYLLVDVSGSMDQEAASIAWIVPTLADELACSSGDEADGGGCVPDVWWGLGTVGYTGGDPYVQRLDVGPDPIAVMSALIDVASPTSGGADEPLLLALHSTVTGLGSGESGCEIPTPYSSRPTCSGSPAGVEGRGFPCFRQDAIPVVVLATDESPSQTFDCPSQAATIAAAQAAGALVIGLDTGGTRTATADLRALALATGAVDADGEPVVASGDQAQAGPGLLRVLQSFLPTLTESAFLDLGVRIAGGSEVATRFVDRVQTEQLGTPECADGLVETDTDGDGLPDAFVQVASSASVCWQLAPKANVDVPQTGAPQVFSTTLQVVADGAAVVEERGVHFIVPQAICQAGGAGCQPAISVTYPPRGATIQAEEPVVQVSGQVSGVSGALASFTVNDIAVELDSTGAFSVPVPVAVGGNVLTLQATDESGASVSRSQSLLWSSAYLSPSPGQPMDETVPQGLATWLDQELVDDGDRTSPPDDLATVVEAELGERLSFESLHDPTALVVTGQGYDVYLESLDYADASVSLFVTASGLSAHLEVSEIQGSFFFDCTNVMCLALGGDSTGGVSVESVVVDVPLGVTVGSDHSLDVAMGETVAVVGATDVWSNSSLTNFLITVVEQFVVGTLVPEVEAEIEQVVTASLSGVVEPALATLAGTTSLPIPALDAGGAPVSVAFTTDFASSEPFAGSGVELGLRAAAMADRATPYQNLGVPLRVGCGASPGTLEVSRTSRFETALALDTLNQALYAAWQGGLLEYSLPSGAVGASLTSDLSLTSATVSGTLAPTLSDCDPAGLSLLVGDVRLEASLERGGQAFWAVLQASADLQPALTLAEGVITVQGAASHPVAADIATVPDGVLNVAELEQLRAALVAALLDSLVGRDLVAVPLPKLDASAVRGLPPGSLVLGEATEMEIAAGQVLAR